MNASAALLGKKYLKRKKPIIWEYRHDIKPGDPRDVSPQLAIRDGDWKFLMDYDGSRPELYNLTSDPTESENLAEKNPKRVKAMSAQLEKWLKSTASARN